MVTILLALLITPRIIYIEDIYFFEVNTKYISSSVLKTSEFSRVKILMFSTHEMKYIWYLPKKSKFSFYFVLFIGYMQCLTLLKIQKRKILTNPNKRKILANPNNFGTKLFVTF